MADTELPAAGASWRKRKRVSARPSVTIAAESTDVTGDFAKNWRIHERGESVLMNGAERAEVRDRPSFTRNLSAS